MSEESLNTVDTTVTTDTATVTESQIYVGPNIASERLNRFAVFKNGLPSHMEDTFTACPAVKKLCVPVSKLSETLDKINKTGTAYHTWYSQVTAYLQKGVK